MQVINIKSSSRIEMIEITNEISNIVRKEGIKSGVCVIYSPHTTAGITINEGADPSVRRDILNQLSEIIPFNKRYSHTEGNSDAHIKTSLIGCSEAIIIEEGRLCLGTWQSIYFCEFDGPRSRQVYVKIIT